MDPLTIQVLQAAVEGDYAAIRRVTTLKPAGQDDKVFPPTYEGAEYATEQRNIHRGDSVVTVNAVLLDSAQSQANRGEAGLLTLWKSGRLKFPLLQSDFAAEGVTQELKDIGVITALEAPHRIADAIFRDSLHNGVAFRESAAGTKLDTAKTTNATPVFELCPTALIFGFWDSTGPRGGMGAKVQRALVSEIVGYGAVPGARPSSRIDPLAIESSVEIYQKAGGGWTPDEKQAVTKDNKPVRYGKEGKASEINHGNITPSLKTKDGKPNHGGVTLDNAIQTTVLSLAALRKLRFPINGSGRPDQTEIDNAARATLAALGLAAICALDLEGYDLRSRCLLDGKPGKFEFVGRGETRPFAMDLELAAQLLEATSARARKLGLPWPVEPLTLTPSPELQQLVMRSRQKKATEPVAGQV